MGAAVERSVSPASRGTVARYSARPPDSSEVFYESRTVRQHCVFCCVVVLPVVVSVRWVVVVEQSVFCSITTFF